MLGITKLKYFLRIFLPRKRRLSLLEKAFVSTKYNPSPDAMRFRNLVAKELLSSFGENSFIKENVRIKGYEKLKIGHNCSINEGCRFTARGGISIGNWVRISHHCSFHSSTHNYTDLSVPISLSGGTKAKITVGNDVWIGCYSIILQGVTIGDGAVIGANSLVNKDIPPYSIAVGSPAKVIGKRGGDMKLDE